MFLKWKTKFIPIWSWGMNNIGIQFELNWIAIQLISISTNNWIKIQV
jgi:hypothetical protein